MVSIHVFFFLYSKHGAIYQIMGSELHNLHVTSNLDRSIRRIFNPWEYRYGPMLIILLYHKEGNGMATDFSLGMKPTILISA